MTDKEREAKKKKKKKQEQWLEAEIFRIMEKSAEAALKQAMDELFKDWQ